MATRLGLPGHDPLQHFIASPAWDDAPLWTELARQADRLVGGPDACLVTDACLVIDDTALPKKGVRSVGVARQYCGALGKQANGQSLVSLTLAQDEVFVRVGLRLFLPEAWTSDPRRGLQAGVPKPATVPRSKGEIALSELDRLRAEGLRFGTVLAGPVWGSNRHLPGGEVWLVGAWRSSGERKYYLSNLPPGTSRRALAGTIKARWPASRPSSSSRKNSASITSRDAPGPNCIDTR
jgi:hypothetical protein